MATDAALEVSLRVSEGGSRPASPGVSVLLAAHEHCPPFSAGPAIPQAGSGRLLEVSLAALAGEMAPSATLGLGPLSGPFEVVEAFLVL